MQPLKIGIDRLNVFCSVGIYDIEKQARQNLLVSARLFFADAPIEIDTMQQSVDYDTLCAEIQRIAALRHYELIENLALHIGSALKLVARCEQVEIRIDKPLAAQKNGAATIFVEISV